MSMRRTGQEYATSDRNPKLGRTPKPTEGKTEKEAQIESRLEYYSVVKKKRTDACSNTGAPQKDAK